MRKNIVLTGLMGTGKTTIGKMIARKIKYKFLDTDTEIEKREGMTIKEIFENRGEKYFRKLEEELSKEISKFKCYVISTGGGMVINEKNIAYLRKNGIIINLTAKPKTLWLRLKHKNDRPLLYVKEPQKLLKKLLKEREYHYKKADLLIDTTKLTPEEVVDKIIKFILSVRKENKI